MEIHTYTHTYTHTVQLAFTRGGSDGSQKEIARVLQERNQLRTKVNELKRENSNLQKKMSLKADKQSDKEMTDLKVCILLDGKSIHLW